MSLHTPHDIPLQITVPSEAAGASPLVSSERRVTPSWTISHLKTKLEPITGIPSTSQSLRTRSLDGTWIQLDDEDSIVGDARYSLRRGAEIEVQDLRPPHLRATTNFDDPTVDKYVMPETAYAALPNTVLSWKKNQKLGRFDPSAPSAADLASSRLSHDSALVQSKGIKVGERCRVGADDGRRGVVRFVGEIPGLGGEREAGCVWVGVQLDEPVGRNDGSCKTRRVFECGDKYGVFARPEKMEVGTEWGVLDDLGDEDMEEI
ncbi:uncharacterized protein HMPREF1541_10799 [Cyphellophora europaea CBS 101466]|uniref:CAP-Gly domain-containing protein n=1 Tax=Cyphellophora europaea (strain CBS 101466) TaxID=1220924 RepID=W2S865_CYPE1|nr:uncharacterized protein HMPREF1541_10799 [Cyphellophora europaea CBS 101466]ETN44248.1 hypothetical protein HMPREF1541_10799 [Cyphellophora europaea CBS 101466]